MINHNKVRHSTSIRVAQHGESLCSMDIQKRVGELMAQLEVKDHNNCNDQNRNYRTNNPFVSVHSPWHSGQDFLASSNILINPMQLVTKLSVKNDKQTELQNPKKVQIDVYCSQKSSVLSKKKNHRKGWTAYCVMGMQKWLALLMQIFKYRDPNSFSFLHGHSALPNPVSGLVQSFRWHQ